MGTFDDSEVITNLHVTLLFVIAKIGLASEMRQTCDKLLFGSSSNEETNSSVGGIVGRPMAVKVFVALSYNSHNADYKG